MFAGDIKEKPERLPFDVLKQRIREEENKGNDEVARLYRTEYHRKFAIAFGSLIFGILGIALGIRPTRAVKSGSFVFTLLFVGLYWTFVMSARSFATHGWIHPGLAMWLPNLLFLTLSGFLLYRTNRQ